MTKIEQLMEQVNGSTFISIDTVTDVRLPGGKKNLLQGKVTKHTSGSHVMVFQNKTTNGYENMVKRRLVQEGKNPENFKLSPRTWGERRKGSPFVDHNGELYLEVIFLKSGTSVYMVNNETEIDKEVLNLPSTPEGEQGGLENSVIIRTYKVSSIKRITINKQTYDL